MITVELERLQILLRRWKELNYTMGGCSNYKEAEIFRHCINDLLEAVPVLADKARDKQESK